MPFLVSSDFWLEVPAGRYRLGLTPQEARSLAEQSAPYLEAKGVDLSLSGGKMIRKAVELIDTAANIAWVEKYLLENHAARDVELPAFAIARQPITSGQYRTFMEETGETEEPSSWERGEENREPGVPVVGLTWGVTQALAAWAGARVPFADEWERAVRGPEHRIFPWGNQHDPIGPKTLEEGFPRVLPASLTRTPEGLDGAVNANAEWCGDYADDEQGHPWGRTMVGWAPLSKVVPSVITRAYVDPFTQSNERCMIRLVRADERQTPPVHPTTPVTLRADEATRVLETHVVVPVLGALDGSPLARSHTIETNWSGNFWNNAAADKIATVAMGRARGLRSGMRTDPNQWLFGRYLALTSNDQARRNPAEHGVFVWNIQYRLGADGIVRARTVTAFRMAFDKTIHRFENRFRPDEPDTAIEHLTHDLVRANIHETFAVFERTADSAVDPTKT